MSELKRLQADHASAVLAFELANRTYFAVSVSDRGDDFFGRFTDRYNASLAEQESGSCAFYVLVDADGSVLGRFNLYDLEDGTARLGYRVAERVAGRGVADSTAPRYRIAHMRAFHREKNPRRRDSPAHARKLHRLTGLSPV